MRAIPRTDDGVNLWLARNDNLHSREKDEKERKRLEKLPPRVFALYSKVDLLLLACDKPRIFELPIQERLKLHSRELETSGTTCHSHCQTSTR